MERVYEEARYRKYLKFKHSDQGVGSGEASQVRYVDQ
jgi:hypothetical protein